MDCRIGDLRYKEVINVNTGLRLGFVSDAVFDINSGQMSALVVPGEFRIAGIFGKGDDYIIPWSSIRRIGDDIILVEEARPQSRQKKRRVRWDSPGEDRRK